MTFEEKHKKSFYILRAKHRRLVRTLRELETQPQLFSVEHGVDLRSTQVRLNAVDAALRSKKQFLKMQGFFQ
jgi:hypothetical protein